MARNPGIPHYRRLINLLQKRLSQPAAAGMRLPSERALARRFRLARNTVRRALAELKDKDLLTRMPGSGTYRRHAACPAIYGLGYTLTSKEHGQLFEWLEHELSSRGYCLKIRETDLTGKHLPVIFAEPELRRAHAFFWLVTSHPGGHKLACAFRRRLPPQMPLVLMNDPLGLTLHGRHRVDLIHYDYVETVRRLVSRLAEDGFAHPILIRRPEIDLRYSSDQIKIGFIAQLVEQGISDPMAHIVDWSPTNARVLCRIFQPDHRRRWHPSAIIIPWTFQSMLKDSCRTFGHPLPVEIPIVSFGDNRGPYQLPLDQRHLAEICADLLLSRLRQPRRPNLHVLMPMRCVGQ